MVVNFSCQFTYPCSQGRGGFSIPPPHVFTMVRQVKPQVTSWCAASLLGRRHLFPIDSGLYWWGMGHFFKLLEVLSTDKMQVYRRKRYFLHIARVW